MWLNSRDAEDAAADAPRDASSVWAYGAASPSPSPSNTSSVPSASLGAINLSGAASNATSGGAHWRSRLLWNRTEPEEEEREEEALPSYLSYLQHPMTLRSEPSRPTTTATTSASIPPGMTSSSSTSSTRAYRSFPESAPVTAASEMEDKSKELAFALQDFILTQMQAAGTPRPPLPPRPPSGQPTTTNACSCGCESLRVRVAELTHQVHALQGQVTSLLKSTGGLSSSAPAFLPPGGSAGGMVPMPPLPPPPPSPHHHQHLQVGVPPHHMQQQPPMPMPPPPSPVGSAGSAGNALTDRVSTLEGRQSAFQSQLAQIAKVLGVPAGKQSKNAQVKTLVQTLREEIDAKIETAVNEMEASIAASVREQTKQDALDALEERIRDLSSELSTASPTSSSPSSSPVTPSSLSYDAILSALASEHEASLGRLSAAIEELVGEESKQRAQLEQRVESHFSRHEEWLQQLEGELGSRFERPVTPSSARNDWAEEAKSINDKLARLEAACEENRAQWRTLLAGVAARSIIAGGME